MALFRKTNTPDLVELTISNGTVIRILILVILSFIGFVALRKATHALTLIFTALFLAIALNRPVQWLASHLPGRRRGNRTLAVALSFLVVVILLAGFIASLIPPIVRQTNNFIDAAPGLIEQVQSDNSSLGEFVRRYHLQDQVDKFADQLGDRLQGVSSTAVSGISRVSSSVFSTLTVLVLTFMMLVEGPGWVALGRRLTPDGKSGHFERLARSMYRVITGFVNGQVTLAALAAVLILPALFLFHVSYPIALMMVVFICGLIPLVGHTIGAIIVSAVALFTSPLSALGILIYYITYQQIENYAIQPKIQANSTDMSPLLVFSSVIIGVSFNGILGGLVAIPVAGCLRILILDYFESRQLLKPSEVKEATQPKSAKA